MSDLTFTHLDPLGRARMVDVTPKEPTHRRAVARGRVEMQPATTWAIMAPGEYGFFANVNPDVSHPRWSQAKERRIGEFFNRATLPFNGYANEVASLYTGMDPRRLY